MDQLATEALVVSFSVVMCDELSEEVPKVSLAESS
jgi:hypothetical protein